MYCTYRIKMLIFIYNIYYLIQKKSLFILEGSTYLLNNEEWPECTPCCNNYSLKHVLIDYVDVADVRQTFYNVNNLYDVFTKGAGEN
jgi:hypothetical protein